MSNTADRLWFRVGARWIARFDIVGRLLRLAFLALTGVSTATMTLKQYGHGNLAWPLIGVTAVVVVLFTYGYTEGGGSNQTQRDKRDLSNNFAGPNGRIVSEMKVRALMAGLVGRELEDHERDVIESELDTAFYELRDGVEIED